jgi:hypothetical protein
MNHAGKRLQHQYSFRDFVFYTTLAAVPLLTAFLAIAGHSVRWAVIYILLVIGLLALVVRFYCTRCPHYNRAGDTVKCLFIWGLPKKFAPRPGPLDKLDIVVTVAASGLLLVFPVYWLLLEPGMLIIYGLSLGGVIAAVRRNECERCIYYECPANKVPADLRQESQSVP